VIDALDRFDGKTFDSFAIRRSSLRFSRDRFLREIGELIPTGFASPIYDFKI